MNRRIITILLGIVPFASTGLCNEPVDDASVTPLAATGVLRGVTRDPSGEPLPEVRVAICNMNENTPQMTLSGNDGTFLVAGLKPGKYQITAEADGYETELPITVDVTDQQTPSTTVPLAKTDPKDAKKPAGFFSRLAKAYYDDWHPGPDTGDAKHRFYDPPESNPPYPFAVWPIGGAPWIGYNNATSYPLTTALQNGPNGEWWKKWNIQIYGWANAGFNFSTSTQAVGGKYANAPMGYNQIPNSFQLDQVTLYIERTPDTIQTDHFDWGFRFTNLYGLDYRFTTADGYFSQQLLHTKPDGTLGNQYGYDPVMFYIDLYFPHVAEGMILRLGRYISLPDIEAQLAPNNYTYTHSLTYTYDCYTQTGANATIKFSEHFTFQVGISPGCETAAWKPSAQWTGNTCEQFEWRGGQDNLYFCQNSINRGRYGYNNLAAYYATWYHKIDEKWHTATESWYQYESHTPNIFNAAAANMIILNTNGAWCKTAEELTCYAPDWSLLNYTNRQLKKKDFISFRNELFDDLRGQRTGFKGLYIEDGISWNHWIGSTIVLRPELRWEHNFDELAYDGGHRHSQFMFASDIIWFF
jgi:Putative beta-barrel porin-2, OmpL-like. bbp2/Carboxypeptidase regulatory-like domain